jgi:hypothetical protein
MEIENIGEKFFTAIMHVLMKSSAKVLKTKKLYKKSKKKKL